MSTQDTASTATRKVTLDRTFAAPRDRVFRAWTDPDQLARWWGPTGFSTPRESVTIELHPGGRYHKTMVLESPEIAAGMQMEVGAEFPDHAEVVEVVEPELLVLASEPQPELGLVERTVTRVEFHDQGDGTTRVTLVDGPYTEMMGGHAASGWSQSFGKLEALLATA
jgi:uncharacterized protein YndB with AHSA1/START domain